MPVRLYKRYVEVIVKVDTDGMFPLFILWDTNNGTSKYKIDKILSIKQHYSIVGGAGIRFECVIQNEVRFLFYEKEKRWFIESMKP